MNYPVIAIPPSYDKNENLDLLQTISYSQFLLDQGAKRLMTTAGTSHFNLLSIDEIHSLNKNLSCLDCETILGVPSLSLKNTLDFIQYANKNYDHSKTSLILLFPERFYTHSQVYQFFEAAANLSKFPCYVHGKTIKKASGGNFDFDKKLIDLLASHPNIVGIKEEHSNLMTSYDVILDCNNLNFEFIVAGSSMRRFLFLENAGAHTFLSGVGNINPKIENDFISYIHEGNREKANFIIKKYENPCFSLFFKIGWHLALRNAIRLKGIGCNYNRRPYPDISKEQEDKINKINILLENYND